MEDGEEDRKSTENGVSVWGGLSTENTAGGSQMGGLGGGHAALALRMEYSVV